MSAPPDAASSGRALLLLRLLVAHTSGHTSQGSEANRCRLRGPSKAYSDISQPLPTWSGAAWSPTSPTSAANSSPPWPRSRERGRTPAQCLIYRYFRARYARAAPTAMPRASSAISLATRWRFTFLHFSTCTRAEAPSKDTPVISLRLDGCTHLVGLARLNVLRDWTASQRERQMLRNPS